MSITSFAAGAGALYLASNLHKHFRHNFSKNKFSLKRHTTHPVLQPILGKNNLYSMEAGDDEYIMRFGRSPFGSDKSLTIGNFNTRDNISEDLSKIQNAIEKSRVLNSYHPQNSNLIMDPNFKQALEKIQQNQPAPAA